MLELVFSICTIGGQLVDCKEKKLTFAEDMVSVSECERGGQLAMAQWLGEHPMYDGWYVKNWSCRHAGIFAKA